MLAMPSAKGCEELVVSDLGAVFHRHRSSSFKQPRSSHQLPARHTHTPTSWLSTCPTWCGAGQSSKAVRRDWHGTLPAPRMPNPCPPARPEDAAPRQPHRNPVFNPS